MLVHVARHGSIAAAARAAGVTASAVSQQISALERDCGVALVDRQPRGVSLTGAGEALLPHAEDVVRVLERAGTSMAQLSGETAGKVRVGTIASAAASLVLPAAKVLRRSAPDVRMGVTTMEPSTSIDALVDGQLDLAVIDIYDHVPVPLPSRLLVEEVLTEPLVLIGHVDADLPPHPTLASLHDHDWVLPPDRAACGSATRYACRSAGYEPRVRWETDDLLLLVASVSRGEGIALLPRRAVADTVAPVSIRELADPVLTRRILTLSRQGAADRPAVRACLGAIHHIAKAVPSPLNHGR
jgi:molybdate transport repressor ModE-like protein